MRLAVVALASSALLVAAAPDAVDSVHRLMEPALSGPRAPRLRRPYPGGSIQGQREGVLTSIGRLVRPQTALVMLPAGAIALALAAPEVLARLLVQLICFIGSLLEPFEMLLPEKGLVRSLVSTVQAAKKAYNVKHGLVTIDDAQFFDDDDDDDDDELSKAKPDGDGGDDGEIGDARIATDESVCASDAKETEEEEQEEEDEEVEEDEEDEEALYS